ncbi:hypothetical protein E1A91_A05G135200v1 [Gossypium mustelinum]|uniref:Acyl-[acyl-carrier-protein] hydrolase n=1 Tax=Gossypium mustelinum TaxID=34275 RepID=A0A5D2Z586_GOSMU|nr:hypothetical protein E1A91_A05G135200v1 [Gossypium mustelinum]
MYSCPSNSKVWSHLPPPIFIKDHCFPSKYIMATSRFFMPPSASTWNKSKVSLQRVNITSNAIQKTVRFSVINCSLKINLHAQPALNGEIRVPSVIKEMENEEITSLSVAGRLVKGGLVFQQDVSVRSFEIDSEYKMSTKAIMNYLQEASLNYAKKLGLTIDTCFGITPGMRKMDLVWVFRGMHIEVDRYPCWGEVVQILHWTCASGRTGVRFDWTINDINTGETLVRASWLKFEVKDEIKAYLRVDVEPIVEVFRYSCPQIEAMDHIKTGLTPGWNDLDVNYHVNNAKYLDWILESTPDSIRDRHELWKINFEYRKECLKEDVIRSLSRVVPNNEKNRGIEVDHVLRLESGHQVLRARTVWRTNSHSCRGINSMKTIF